MENPKKVYNRFYDETKWNNVPKFNKDLINDFLLELKASGIAATAKATANISESRIGIFR